MSDPQTQRSLAIAATFTAEPLLPAMRFVLDEAGLLFDVTFAPYHQVFQELLSTTSLLATNAGGINVILIRIEDYVRETADSDGARTLIKRTTSELVDALSQYARRVEEPTVLAVLPPSPSAMKVLVPDFESARCKLLEHAQSLKGIHLLTDKDFDLVSTGERYDVLRDELAHVPFTEEFYASMALAIARKIHALRVPAHKVLVLDCDNTLWRGVVGEDGVDGIVIPQAFLSVQRFAVSEQEHGTLVCLASKNAERDVLEVLEKRPEMALRADHIVAHRINWESKPSNLMFLARELNLGLDSFVFLDDNPIECAQMRAELPQVVTLQLPPDDEIESFLSHLWTFDKVVVTSEDFRRTSMYRENAARQELEASTTDIAEFVASLELVIDIAPPEEGDWPRLAQLTQRTNQFNFTTIRRTEPEMRAFHAEGSVVLRVNVRDRFGDYGLVGLVAAVDYADSLTIDTLLLSCRVLGRGVEHAMLRHLGELAKERKKSFVILPYSPTAKNEPARAFAESIATVFAVREAAEVVYRIPVAAACAIAHRPGHDPEAVIKARESEGKKAAVGTSPSATSSSNSNRSERYAKLARKFVSGGAILEAMRAQNVRARTLPGSAAPPATHTERKLLALWQELLGIEGLGVEDNYFALGGTSLLAARMFAEIARCFGMKLRLTTILEAPTVRELANYIEPQGVARACSLVELKRGGSRNLFLVHDGDGETLLYLNLARRMSEEYSVYGIEPLRVPGVPLAHASIEAMAAFYVEEVRKLQPRGPYLLGGMCAGGVIAYEMASQLVRANDRVELVALLDAAKPQAQMRTGRIAKQRLGRLAQVFADARSRQKLPVMRAYLIVSTALRKLFNTISWEVVSRGRQLSTRVRFRLLREVLARHLSWPSFIAELSVREIYNSSEASYVPKPLFGAGVLLARALAGEGGDVPYREVYADETFGWGSIVKDLAVADVEGGHASMLQEKFVESLASVLISKIGDNIRQKPVCMTLETLP
jgi:FkbH-like protein